MTPEIQEKTAAMRDREMQKLIKALTTTIAILMTAGIVVGLMVFQRLSVPPSSVLKEVKQLHTAFDVEQAKTEAHRNQISAEIKNDRWTYSDMRRWVMLFSEGNPDLKIPPPEREVK